MTDDRSAFTGARGECEIFPHCHLEAGHAGWCQRITDDRSEMQAARDAGLRARHETREARARTVIGEYGQQAIVSTSGDRVRLWVCDEEGESGAIILLPAEAAERLARVLIQTSAQVGARPCQPGCEFVAPHPSHPCGQYTRERP